MNITSFKEFTGKGLEATVNNVPVKIGAAHFINQNMQAAAYDTGTSVHIVLNNVHMGKYKVANQYRDGLMEMAKNLKEEGFEKCVLSGDNNTEKSNLIKLFGDDTWIKFEQKPQEKLDYIKYLQSSNKKVLMLGDGLNDAGALKQADTGIAVSDNNAQFTPASDAILDGSKVHLLDKFLAYAKSGKNIVIASFVLSIIYNIVGLSFATQALLSPMVAAILMPISSISIVILVTVLSSVSAKMKGL